MLREFILNVVSYNESPEDSIILEVPIFGLSNLKIRGNEFVSCIYIPSFSKHLPIATDLPQIH